MYYLIFLGLTFVQKKVRQGSYLEFHETDICIDLCQLEQAFIAHFDDRSIQVREGFKKIKK